MLELHFLCPESDSRELTKCSLSKPKMQCIGNSHCRSMKNLSKYRHLAKHLFPNENAFQQ